MQRKASTKASGLKPLPRQQSKAQLEATPESAEAPAEHSHDPAPVPENTSAHSPPDAAGGEPVAAHVAAATATHPEPATPAEGKEGAAAADDSAEAGVPEMAQEGSALAVETDVDGGL